MVFMSVIRWIAGIFGHSEPEDVKRFVEKNELDEIVEVILSGFNSINSKVDVMGNEFGNYTNGVNKRLDTLESHSDDMYLKLEQLQKNFDDVSMQVYRGENNTEVEALRSVFNTRIAEIDKQLTMIGSNEIPVDVVSREDLSRLQEIFDEKLATMDKGLVEKVKTQMEKEMKSHYHLEKMAEEMGKLSKKINDVGSRSHSVATKSNNVTTKLPQKKEIEKITIEKPVGVINTVVTEKTIKGRLPHALLPAYNILLNAEKRISYAELAARIKRKEATARSYVNDLRKYGVSIEEESGPNGRKFIRLSKKARQEHMIPE